MQSEVLKFVDATDLPGSFSAPLRLFGASTFPSAKLVRRSAASHQAGVYWIQAPAGTSSLRDSVELSEQRAALRLNLTLT